MLVISSREFRENQKSYFDKLDEGVEILVQRGNNKAYKIVSVTENDEVTKEDYVLSPDEDFHRAITMDELLVGIKEDIREMFRKANR
jgi:Phd_YefM.